MIAYGNPGSGLIHPCDQPKYVAKIQTESRTPPRVRPVIVDGKLYQNRTLASKATGICNSTLKEHADNGKPCRGHVIRWGDESAT
jgi:hypothetical protein